MASKTNDDLNSTVNNSKSVNISVARDTNIGHTSNKKDINDDQTVNKNTIDNKPDDNSLLVFYSNVDQLMNKRTELQSYITKNNPDIIQLTEVLPKRINPKNKVDIEQEFNLQGYNMFYNENPKRGTIIYINENLDFCYLKPKVQSTLLEDVWCTGIVNSKKVLLGCVYRSPNQSNKAESTQELINTLNLIEFSKFDMVLIMGDFNYPDLKWNNPNEMDIHSLESKFLNCTEELFL